MPEQSWPDTWRAWLRARYGDRLADGALDAAVEACEALRRMWEPVLAAELANGALPFPNALPPLPGAEPPTGAPAVPPEGEEGP